MSSQETREISPMKINFDIGQRGSGHLVVSSAARRPDTELAISRRMRWNEAMGKPRKCGRMRTSA
jgi:hypothetical protein